MARNLTRNTKVYVSNQAVLANCTNANTWEIKVLDGYDFSQATTTEDITISEAGTTPIRGQKTFNTAQEPADVTLVTYIRPYVNATPLVDSPEKILWASLGGSVITANASGDMVTNVTGDGTAVYQQASGTGMLVDFEESDSNELGKLTIWFHLENSTYRVDNVNMSTAEIDFAIDAIAQISWSGMGTNVTELNTINHAIVSAWVPGTAYTATPPTTSDSFLRNKLSSMTLSNTEASPPLDAGTALGTHSSTTISDTNSTWVGDAVISDGDYIRNDTIGETRIIQSFTETEITIEGEWDTTPVNTDSWIIYSASEKAMQNYTIAITGGSLTIENNMDFLTPEELGVVNQPLPGFAGSRGVTGSITAYLDTGFYGTAALLNDILEDINSVTNSYAFDLYIGGTAVTPKHVQLSLATAQLAVPTINVEDVIATEITFSGQGSAGALENRDEVVVTYQAT